MTLQKQKLFLNFGQGIDTKTDEKLVVPGKLLELKNGVFKKTGRIDKRAGSEILSAKTLAGDTLSDATSLGTFNNEILQYNKQKLYSLSTGANSWVDKGTCVSASVTTDQVVKNTASQTQVDYAANNGVAVYAWEDSRGGVKASVYDEETMTPLLSDTVIDASGSRAKCCSFKGYLYVFYYKAGNLYVRRINPRSPTSFDTAISLTTDVNTTSPNYDVLPYQDLRVAVVWNKQSASEIKFFFMDEACAQTLTPTDITGAATSCLSVVEGAGGRFFVLWANTSDGLRCAIQNNGGSAVITPFTVENYTATEILNVTGVQKRDALGIAVFYHVNIASQTYNHYVRTNTITNGGIAGTPSTFMRSVGLWTKAFSYYFDGDSTDHYYVGLSYSSTLQSTYFIARNDGFIVAKLQYGAASGHPTRRLLQTVNHETEHTFSFAIINKTKLVSENNDVFSLNGIAKSSLNFDSEEQFNAVQLGNNLHIAGGILSMYDGQSVVEHGFHLFPEALAMSTSGVTGVPAGDYNYVAVYEWTDNLGQLHRSAASIPKAYTVASDTNVLVAVPTLRLTQKKSDANRTNCVIALYRTEEGPGSIYYRVSSVTSPNYNDATADTVTITDTMNNTDILTKEVLYSTGGVLENIPPPSCKYLRSFKDRIFLAGLEDKNQLWYSKIHSSGEPVEFSQFLTMSVASEGGGISAIYELDDKFIISKPDRFFATFGDGPNNAGEGQEFAKPEIITADAGIENNNSIVRIPGGLMFKTKKGIYSLSSSLQLDYTGAPVDNFNSYTITSATLKSDQNQVRFTTLESPTLVFDYYQNQWSTFATQKLLDSVIWNDSYIFLDSSGKVYKEISTSFRDEGRAINLDLTTGWIALDTIGGSQRLYKIVVVGEYKSPHKLRVAVGYDFSSDFSDNYVFDPEDSLGVTTYGEDSPYGSGTPYGGNNTALRFEIGVKKQKCQAFRIKIQDLITSATEGSGEGFNLTGIILEVGIRGQAGKYKLSQKIARS